MEMLPREEAFYFLGPIPVHIGPHYLEGFEKLSQTFVQNVMKKMLCCGSYFISDWCDGKLSFDKERQCLARHTGDVV